MIPKIPLGVVYCVQIGTSTALDLLNGMIYGENFLLSGGYWMLNSKADARPCVVVVVMCMRRL